jgi:uncharacterized protein YndB with AHSA1/START domain
VNKAAAGSAVRAERDIAAPPEAVFDAWLDPVLVARWMAPGSTRGSAQIESRLGGRYRVVHSTADGPVGGFDATIIELDRPNRLVFAWGMVGADGELGRRFDSRLTILFDHIPTGTRLSLIHEELDAFAAAMPEIADLIETGWNDVLSKLAGILE